MMFRFAMPLLTMSTASKISKPWGNYDGNGGLRDGHYCADNSLSPPTNFNFSSGYWAGITWASTNPAAGVYNFSEVDAILRAAETLDLFVEFNALIGQCSPTWIAFLKLAVLSFIQKKQKLLAMQLDDRGGLLQKH